MRQNTIKHSNNMNLSVIKNIGSYSTEWVNVVWADKNMEHVWNLLKKVYKPSSILLLFILKHVLWMCRFATRRRFNAMRIVYNTVHIRKIFFILRDYAITMKVNFKNLLLTLKNALRSSRVFETSSPWQNLIISISKRTWLYNILSRLCVDSPII